MSMTEREMIHEDISKMTEKFIKDGGRVKKYPFVKDFFIPHIFEKWMNPSIKGGSRHWVDWDVDREIEENSHKEHRLCPFNVYRINEEKNPTYEFWTEKLIPLFKEENPEWETDEDSRSRINKMMEYSSNHLN